MDFEKPEDGLDNISEDKLIELENIRSKVEQVTDGLGLKIDENIKDTVIYLNALGFNTNGSCEGHLEYEGKRWNHLPYVSFEAPGVPKYRFEEQEKIYKKVAAEHGISIAEMRRYGEHEDALDEAWQKLSEFHGDGDFPFTSEMIKWIKQNKRLYKKLEALLEEFYEDREVSPENRLILVGNYETNWRVTNDGGVHEDTFGDGFMYSKHDKQIVGSDDEISKKISDWQTEMSDFTNFLKNKFLTQ